MYDLTAYQVFRPDSYDIQAFDKNEASLVKKRICCLLSLTNMSFKEILFSFIIILILSPMTLAQNLVCQEGMFHLISTIRSPHFVKSATEIVKDSFCHGIRFNDSSALTCVDGVSQYWNDMTQVVFEVNGNSVIQDVCNRTIEESLEWNCLTCQIRVESAMEIMYCDHWNQFYGTLIGPSFCQNATLVQDAEACRTFMRDFGELGMEHLLFVGRNELQTQLCFATFGQCEGQNECIKGIAHLQDFFEQEHVIEATKAIIKEQVCPIWTMTEMLCQDFTDVYWTQIVYRAGNSSATPNLICQNFALFVPESPLEPGWDSDVCQDRVGQIQLFLRAITMPLTLDIIGNLVDYDGFCVDDSGLDEKCLISLSAFLSTSMPVLFKELSLVEPTVICSEVYSVCSGLKTLSGGKSPTNISFTLLVLIFSQWPLYQILK